jgi:multisubunit Na+/H+ antiporter MnhG subunit
MAQGSFLFIGLAVLGLLLLVVGLTTFLWLPLLVIALVGLFAAPLWGMIVADADVNREGTPSEP